MYKTDLRSLVLAHRKHNLYYKYQSYHCYGNSGHLFLDPHLTQIHFVEMVQVITTDLWGVSNENAQQKL